MVKQEMSSGYSVSLSSDGSIVAIGAKYNDGNGDYSGHVRVYKFKIPTSIEWNNYYGNVIKAMTNTKN